MLNLLGKPESSGSAAQPPRFVPETEFQLEKCLKARLRIENPIDFIPPFNFEECCEIVALEIFENLHLNPHLVCPVYLVGKA